MNHIGMIAGRRKYLLAQMSIMFVRLILIFSFYFFVRLLYRPDALNQRLPNHVIYFTLIVVVYIACQTMELMLHVRYTAKR